MTVLNNELDELHKKVETTRQRVYQADEHIKQLGEGAQKVGLSINGALLEINALLKDLFLCSQHDLPEYDLLQAELLRHLQNIHVIVDTRFGKIKVDDKEKH